jgi:hypothetical protein
VICVFNACGGDEYEWILNSGKCKEKCRSQWPLGVRRRSAAARLMRLCSNSAGYMKVCVGSVVFLQVGLSATS